MTTNVWETILNAGKSNDENCDGEGAEEPQVEPGPAPGDDDD